MNANEIRVYPVCCQSAYCGKVDCAGCRNEAILRDFQAWKDATGAVRTDRIWCPAVWTAQRDRE